MWLRRISNSREMGGAMKVVLAGLCLGLFVVLPPPMSFDMSAGARPTGAELERMMRSCRRQVFRKYSSQRNARGRRVLPSSFVTSQVDACIANGGRAL